MYAAGCDGRFHCRSAAESARKATCDRRRGQAARPGAGPKACVGAGGGLPGADGARKSAQAGPWCQRGGTGGRPARLLITPLRGAGRRGDASPRTDSRDGNAAWERRARGPKAIRRSGPEQRRYNGTGRNGWARAGLCVRATRRTGRRGRRDRPLNPARSSAPATARRGPARRRACREPADVRHCSAAQRRRDRSPRRPPPARSDRPRPRPIPRPGGR